MFRYYDPHRRKDRGHKKIASDNAQHEKSAKAFEAFYAVVEYRRPQDKETPAVEFTGFQTERASERRTRRAAKSVRKPPKNQIPPTPLPPVWKLLPKSQEKLHFGRDEKSAVEFASTLSHLIRRLRDKGLTKSVDVSDHLNLLGIKTARGQIWTPRLARFLLCLVYRKRFPLRDDYEDDGTPKRRRRVLVPV